MPARPWSYFWYELGICTQFHFELYQCALCTLTSYYSFQIVATFLSVRITGDSQEDLGWYT